MRNFGDFLEHPVSDLAGPLLGAELHETDTIAPGTRFGAYRVIREIGRGGMGVVCLAERDGAPGQRVALKIVQRKFAVEPSALRRFREERQILAPLQHPGIAGLEDGGVEPDGTPWFAMEYVDGIPIDRFCTVHSLEVRERLELFAMACDAVEHAHRQSIVHRDIKPSHILVTERRAVKLLDFGIAKLAMPDGGEGVGVHDPTFTQPQLLTPAYASPEQLRGERVSTASDVYALGVVLHRLITGKTPARRAADVVRGAKPRTYEPPPSLGPEVPAPLNLIATTALQPEMQRRYPSAGALAADVRAFLSGAPIAARPVSAARRLPTAVHGAMRKHGRPIMVVIVIALIVMALILIG